MERMRQAGQKWQRKDPPAALAKLGLAFELDLDAGVIELLEQLNDGLKFHSHDDGSYGGSLPPHLSVECCPRVDTRVCDFCITRDEVSAVK